MFHDEHSLTQPEYVAKTQNPLLHISPFPQPINPNSKHESSSKFPHTLYAKSFVQNLSFVHSSTQEGTVVVVVDVENVVVVVDWIVVVVDVVGLRVVVVVGNVVVVEIGMHFPRLHVVDAGQKAISLHSKHTSESKFPQTLNPLLTHSFTPQEEHSSLQAGNVVVVVGYVVVVEVVGFSVVVVVVGLISVLYLNSQPSTI